MDVTYVCVIIGGTIRKIKIEFIFGGGPAYKAKTMRTERKLTWTVNLHIRPKKVYHFWISHMYVLSLEVL